MAQRVVVTLTDDVDGGNADETVTFSLDGVTYEVDLSEANATSLRESMALYIGAGRRTGRGRVMSAPRRDREYDPAAVREWAGRRGIEVSPKGRIPRNVVEDYKQEVRNGTVNKPTPKQEKPQAAAKEKPATATFSGKQDVPATPKQEKPAAATFSTKGKAEEKAPAKS